MTTLRELRKARGWSQTQLAIRAGVSLPTVSKIERGAECMPLTKKALADALGVSPDEITITVVNQVLKRA